MDELRGGTISPITNNTLCLNGTPEKLQIVDSNNGINPQYQWEYSTDGTSFEKVLKNGTSASYQSESISQTTYFRRKVSVMSDKELCSSNSDVYKVNVIDFDPGEIQSKTVTVCYDTKPGTLSEESAPKFSSGVISYQWERSIENQAWERISGANEKTYSPPVLKKGTRFRRKVIVTLNGVSCTKISQNIVTIEISKNVNIGVISENQTICEGENPETLAIRYINGKSPSESNLSYQWESSTSSITGFKPINGQNTTDLVFTPDLSPKITTYYQVKLIGENNCTATTNIVEIKVQPSPILNQIGNSKEGEQIVCVDKSIIPIVFEYGESATGLIFNPSESSLMTAGLIVDHDEVNKQYTITGIPTKDVSLIVQTIGSTGDICEPKTLNYDIVVVPKPQTPHYINVDGSLIWERGYGQTGKYSVCQGIPSSQLSGKFYFSSIDNATDLKWKLVGPVDAGNVDSSGKINWNAKFHGKATFSVSGQSSCDASISTTNSVTFEITVIKNNRFIDFGLEPIGEIEVSNFLIDNQGSEPTCGITDNSLDTQYVSVGHVNQVIWSYEVVRAENINVPLPGTLSSSGRMSWATGFLGTIIIRADPTNCDGDNDFRTGTISQTFRKKREVTIKKADTRSLDIFVTPSGFGSSLPTCKGDTRNKVTHFESNEEASQTLFWTINNPNAGIMNPITGELSWIDGFSGLVTIKAEIYNSNGNCPLPSGEMLIEVPDTPSITLISEKNSNIGSACQNTAITTITYSLGGAATGAQTVGLPEGVSANFTSTPQITSYTFSGKAISKGEIYTVAVNNNNYSFTTTDALENNTTVVQKLVELMASDPTILPSADGAVLKLTGRIVGKSFASSLSKSGASPQITISAPNTVAETRIFTISGSSDGLPGNYPFSVKTTSDSASCFTATNTGTILIRPNASLTLASAINTDAQTVCNESPITDIVYDIQNAGEAYVEPNGTSITDGLPNGLVGKTSNGQLIISGTPKVSIKTATTYQYTIRTKNSIGSCEEAVITGTITVEPDLKAQLISFPFTQNQTVCEGSPIQNVVYQLNGPPDDATGNLNYDISNLPPGIGGTFSAWNNQFVFFGIPQPYPPIDVPTTYSYSLTTTGCDGTSQTITNTIIVNPAPRLELISGLGTDQQIICDTDAITDIEYKFRGAKGYDNFKVEPPVSWIKNYINPKDAKTIIRAKPEKPVENTTTYIYSLRPSNTSYNCDVYPTVSGTITVIPSQQLELKSLDRTLDQEVCNNSAIEDIVYEFKGSTEAASVNGLPTGVNAVMELLKPQKQIKFEGTLATSGEVYTIKINGESYSHNVTSDQSPKEIAKEMADLINANPKDSKAISFDDGSLTLIGENMGAVIDIEVNTSPNANLSLSAPVVLTPSGRLTISGIPKLKEEKSPRVFNYTISSTGENCSSTSVNGKITIRSKPILELTSAVGTDKQIQHNAACDGSEISPITYVFDGGATEVYFYNLPNGISATLTASNTYTISGKLDVKNTVPKTFTYSATTTGESCNPQATVTGEIEVNPLPKIDADYIVKHDITEVSCEGGSDGAITIPMESPEFDLRISGAQHHIRQENQVIITNNPDLSDVFTIEIKGISYEHTVIRDGVGGPVQTANQVANALIDEINTATGALESPVAASLISTSTFLLKAKVAGTPFTVNSVSIAPNTSASTISNTVVVANKTTLYSYSWTGPDGFKSSDLSITGLKAGEYALTVTIGECIGTTANFTVSQPLPITINTTLCNGTMHAEVSGGTAPYTFTLYDDKNNPIDTAVSNNAKTYNDLTPGANYILEVQDDKCTVTTKKAIVVPFDLAYDSTVPVVVDDFCNDDNGDGFIELGGNAAGLSFSGGSNQFSYKWTGPSGFIASTRDIYNLVPGKYTVTIIDDVFGCNTSREFTVGSVDPLIISATTASLASANLVCPDDTTAHLEVLVTGGLGNYTYQWTKNGQVMAGKTSKKIDDLGKGMYEVTVFDTVKSGPAAGQSPCEVKKQFEVKGPSALTMTVNSGTVTKTFCPNSEDKATLDVQISGGVSPYMITVTAEDGTAIEKTTNQLITTITNLDPVKNGSTYTVVIKDSNACAPGTTSPKTIYFERIAPIGVKTTVEQIDCKNGKLGSIQLELTSGKITDPKNVQVQWKSTTTNFYTNWAAGEGKLENITTAGTYQVIVSQDSCELFKESIEINDVNNVLQVDVVEENSGSCNGELGEIKLDIKGGLILYTIKWQKFTAVTTVDTSSTGQTTSTTSSPTTPTTTSFQWVDVPEHTNNAIASNLEVGTYRAIVSDASDELSTEGLCKGTIVTDNFIIGNAVFELASFNINSINASCSSSTSEIRFTIRNSLPNPLGINYEPIIRLNNSDPKDKLIPLGNASFKIIDLQPGEYTLNIKTGTPSETSGSDVNAQLNSCEIIRPFTIDEIQAIGFKGETTFNTDPCLGTATIKIDPSQVEGGIPFNFDGVISYHYTWLYKPDENSTEVTQEYVGNTIANAAPGTYELTIIDSQDCKSDPILFVVNSQELQQQEFVVNGILQDLSGTESSTTSNLVKALPPSCDSSQDNGQIGVSISGGVTPYTIRWFREEVTQEVATSSLTTSFVELTNAKNTTRLDNLIPGTYKLEIRSESNLCNSNNQNNNTYHEEYIIVPKSNELLIASGPFIDEELCKGNPGRLYIELFNNIQEKPTFYYNGKVVVVDEKAQDKADSYTLIIENPVRLADLVITTVRGCKVSTKIEISDIGDPDFEYTTPSYEANKVILAREEITFKNTSPLPFKFSEWIFGDGSEHYLESRTGTVSPVRHSYGISGTYFVTLRNYSELGCFEEKTKTITVGKGYNILAPNVFSPNNDGINEFYRLIFSGFKKVEFKVYDNYGNLLYNEKVEESDLLNLEGLSLKGWDGFGAPSSPYYIYYFKGVLITDETVVERNGTFVLIR